MPFTGEVLEKFSAKNRSHPMMLGGCSWVQHEGTSLWCIAWWSWCHTTLSEPTVFAKSALEECTLPLRGCQKHFEAWHFLQLMREFGSAGCEGCKQCGVHILLLWDAMKYAFSTHIKANAYLVTLTLHSSMPAWKIAICGHEKSLFLASVKIWLESFNPRPSEIPIKSSLWAKWDAK